MHLCLCVSLPVHVYIWLQEEKAEEKTSSPPSGAPATGPAGVAKATAPGGVTKENGVKEPTPTPFGGDGLREPLSIDKHITETSGYKHTHTQLSVLTGLKGSSVVIVASGPFAKPGHLYLVLLRLSGFPFSYGNC